jgi:hypothetical protein
MTALLWILGAGAALYLIVRFSFVLRMRKPRAKQNNQQKNIWHVSGALDGGQGFLVTSAGRAALGLDGL